MTVVCKTGISELSQADYLREYNRLSDINKKKISLLRSDDKRRSLAGLILLRRKLNELYLVDDYEFSYNENGKPLLDFCYFSISHSGSLAVCAVSDRPVGADTEVLREIAFRNDYRLFTLNEVEYVNADKIEHNRRFFEIWTKKEAYIKMMGLKLSDSAGIDVLKISDAVFESEISADNIITVCKSLG